MTKHEFLFHGEAFTSVVMSEEEFSGLCDLIEEFLVKKAPVNVRTGGRMTPADVQALRDAKHVPMVARGTLTAPIFEEYEISANKVSFIVRGQGPSAFFKAFGN